MCQRVTVVLPAVNMGDSVRVLRTEVTSDRASSVVRENPQGNVSASAGPSYDLMESRRSNTAANGKNTKYWWQRESAVMQIRVDVDDGRPRILIAQFAPALLNEKDDRESLANAIAACISSTSIPLGRAELVVAIDWFGRKIAPKPGPELVGRADLVAAIDWFRRKIAPKPGPELGGRE